MMRSVWTSVATLALIGLSACASSGGMKLTTIDSAPQGARVVVENFGECETPCVVQHDAPRRVTVAKAGFVRQDIVITPGQKRVTLALELAAPSGDVEASDLPTLP
ncbi:MAG: PEGA domain-containing protein [Parvularculaceae bacterium]